jgi:hypothetical protein
MACNIALFFTGFKMKGVSPHNEDKRIPALKTILFLGFKICDRQLQGMIIQINIIPT